MDLHLQMEEEVHGDLAAHTSPQIYCQSLTGKDGIWSWQDPEPVSASEDDQLHVAMQVQGGLSKLFVEIITSLWS